jgi:dTDP-4-dehydrorhamnose 3,5-epimerase
MEFLRTDIRGAYAVRLDVRGDARGRFKRHFCKRAFAEAGLATDFVQMNHSVTMDRGAIRGMHYQRPPAAEDKLVSCVLGSAFDVAVDLRRDSPTFLAWAPVEIDDRTAFYIPKGCAHGFQALTREVHLVYLHSEYYTPEAEGGVRFDDPTLAIDWPLPIGVTSERDRSFQLLGSDFEGLDP